VVCVVTPLETVAVYVKQRGGRSPVLDKRGVGGAVYPPSGFGEGGGVPPLMVWTGGVPLCLNLNDGDVQVFINMDKIRIESEILGNAMRKGWE
jgi:hypothetical protein